MKVNKTLTALIASAGLGLSGHAFAAFTTPDAGTNGTTVVTNQTSLSYSVNTIPQSPVDSEEVNFTVDTRVDFAIELNDSAPIKVTPDGTGYVSTFHLANYSNEAIDFSFDTTQLSGNGISFDSATPITVDDTFNLAADAKIYVETNGTPGYQAADNATTVDNLATYDGTTATIAVIYVVVDSNIPLAQVHEDVAALKFDATALTAAGSALPNQDSDSWEEDTRQYVVVNETRSLNTAFEVSSAKFTDPTDDSKNYSIAVEVLNDPICDTDLDKDTTGDYSTGTPDCPDASADYIPKGIPGSLVRYTISAKNSGGETAQGTVLNETLPASFEASSLSQVSLSVGGSARTLTDTSPAAPTVVDEYQITGNQIQLLIGDIAVDTTFEVTITGIVE